MTRRIDNQDSVFRGVAVLKKTVKNPEFIPNKYLGNGVWEYGNESNGVPAILYLDEPDFEIYLGPYFRVGDVNAAFNRYGVYKFKGSSDLAERFHSIRIEQSENKWFCISE